ncbi:bifunctional RNA recognition motif domain/Eukaryotic translation initiation factor 3 subunit G/Nucleotide-binding alpha-beta plait domain superfamily/Eukaryotic translation initiation factor 3 subunit G [Babesia duncani]|uniref:RRM domain-containing protein n=1 Tax=Babesia duncani TaxID=323732 RepID=A0AAD9UPW2_9APIC|nr:bifunctional RNA recognition motif domain/Eukaryotic translation initiation factor 3 subunit G/Nucleotide-binding alpha-beta plait domain superfamily/Eukaryotic translation initiation factor 3 subunit G [Babesia duncani]
MAQHEALAETKWADIEAEDDYDAENLSAQQLMGFETAPDNQGIKTVTSYKKNAKGQTVKVTKHVKEIVIRRNVHKSVQQRKNLVPFNLDTDDTGVVLVSNEEIVIEVPKDKNRHLHQDDDMDCIYAPTDINLTRVARELKQKFKSLRDDVDFEEDFEDKPLNNKFVPSHRREGGDRAKNFDENTIRVTNLSEDVKEKDLTELFGKIGRIHRAYLAKHKFVNACMKLYFQGNAKFQRIRLHYILRPQRCPQCHSQIQSLWLR